MGYYSATNNKTIGTGYEDKMDVDKYTYYLKSFNFLIKIGIVLYFY